MTARTAIRVLIADDHAGVRAATRLLLHLEPDMAVVGEASNGVEALELVAQLNPTIVLMDISMPQMDGIEATRRIRAMRSDLPVLILTSHDVNQYGPALIEAGAAGILPKEISGDRLVDRIRALSPGTVRSQITESRDCAVPGWSPAYATATSPISERQRVRKSRRCSASET